MKVNLCIGRQSDIRDHMACCSKDAEWKCGINWRMGY